MGKLSNDHTNHRLRTDVEVVVRPLEHFVPRRLSNAPAAFRGGGGFPARRWKKKSLDQTRMKRGEGGERD